MPKLLFRLSVLSSAGEPNQPIPVHLRKVFLHPPALHAYPGAVRVPAANSQHDSSMIPVENSLYVLLSPALFSLNKIVEIKYLKSN